MEVKSALGERQALSHHSAVFVADVVRCTPEPPATRGVVVVVVVDIIIGCGREIFCLIRALVARVHCFVSFYWSELVDGCIKVE